MGVALFNELICVAAAATLLFFVQHVSMISVEQEYKNENLLWRCPLMKIPIQCIRLSMQTIYNTDTQVDVSTC